MALQKLFKPVGLGINCDHKGFLVPLVFVPQLIQGKDPAGNPTQLSILMLQTALCVNCDQQFQFGPPPPGGK